MGRPSIPAPIDGHAHVRNSNGRSPSRLGERRAVGRAAVNYKLRDWLFSRQHFWGEPFPILHELDADGQTDRSADPAALQPEDLPLDLPLKKCKFDAEARRGPSLRRWTEAPAEWLYPTHRRQTLQA